MNNKLYLSFFLVILVTLLFPGSGFAVSNPDQNCANVSAGLFSYATRTPGVYFKPRYNILDGISVRVKQVFNDGNGADLTMNVYDYNQANHPNIGSATKHISRDDEYWEMFEFPDISVIPGGSYTFQVSTPELQHVEVHANADPGCYASGYAFDKYLSPLDDRMFGFSTYGRNATQAASTPADDPVSTPRSDGSANPDSPSSSSSGSQAFPGQVSADQQQPSQSGVTTGSRKAPSVPSNKIAKPIDLMAIGLDDGSVKLDWQGSTTSDIDGYKVFRSQKENEGFAEIAKTDKSKHSYIDTNPTINHTNYYFIRAYKADLESESSNTASIIPEKESNSWLGLVITGVIISLIIGAIVVGAIIFMVVLLKRKKSSTQN